MAWRSTRERALALLPLLALAATAKCGFPSHEFDDAKFNIANAGGSSGQGVGGQSGAAGEVGGDPEGGLGGDAGSGSEGGSAGESGVGGDAGAGGEAGAGGAAGSGVGGDGGAGAGGDVGGAAGAGGDAGAGGGGGDAGAPPCTAVGTQTCGVSICKNEVPLCMDNKPVECVPKVGTPYEICADNIDNDCDGKVDNDCKGNCTHDICASAGALASDCNPCVAAICKQNQFFACCSSKWSPDCIAAVGAICKVGTCKGACSHPICEVGTALTANCDKAPQQASCVAKICLKDPTCCDQAAGSWSPACVDLAQSECGYSCNAP
jgi:hypothetical protein